jgi:hypothetical protein
MRSETDGAYRLLGSLTTASQLAPDMLAETRRTGKRLIRPSGHGVAVGERTSPSGLYSIGCSGDIGTASASCPDAE